MFQEKGDERMEDVLYSVNGVAGILKIGKNRVYDLIHAGLLPVLKIGGMKIRRRSLEVFLDKYEGYDLSDPYNIHQMDPLDLEGDD